MKAHFLFLAAAFVLTVGHVAHADTAVHQPAAVPQPSEDPNANDRAKAADMAKNGPSCPLINGSGASLNDNPNIPLGDKRTAAGQQLQ